MIHRTRRDCLADAIHALAAGLITNDEFEESLLRNGIPLSHRQLHSIFWMWQAHRDTLIRSGWRDGFFVLPVRAAGSTAGLLPL